MRIQIQITDSSVTPDKFFVSHYPDEKVEIANLSQLLMAFGKRMGDVVLEELLTGVDSDETVG